MSGLRLLVGAVCAVAVTLTAAPPVAAAPPTNGSIVIGHLAPDFIDPALADTPADVDIDNQLFRGLTAWDSRTGTLSLDLATGYIASTDAMTWTFELRPDAKWSDGRPVTAADEAFAIQRAGDPTLPGDPGYRAFVNGLIASATAVGQRSVQFQLTRPAAYFPALLTLWPARPVPETVVQTWGSSWTDPAHIVTSGAYTVTSETAGSMALSATGHGRHRPPITQVTYQFAVPATLSADFAAGTLDFLETNNLGTVASFKANPALAPYLTVTGPDDVTEFLIFNAAHGSTANANVRLALSAATDRAGISALVNADPAFAARTLTAPSNFGSVPPSAGVGVTYDPSAANAHRAAAGSAFPTSVTINYPCSPRRQQEAQFLKSDWEGVFGSGFTVNLTCGGAGQVINGLTNPDPTVQADVTIIAWAEDYPDANNWLSDNRTIHFRWSDAGYSADLTDAAAALDANRRLADYTDAEDILLDRVAGIATLYYRPDAYLSQPRLTVKGDRIENWTVA